VSPLNVLQFAAMGLMTVLIGVPAVLIGLLIPGRSRKGRFFRYVAKAYCGLSLPLFRIRVRATGLENIDPAKPYVFMANHISHADAPALAVILPQPIHWVFKKELGAIPFFGWALRAGGQIMVDRADRQQAAGALRKALEGLSGNNSIMIYPEGTRSRDGRLLQLKKGGFRMAVQSGIPIVPVRVSGTREIVAADSLRVIGGTASIEILPPISVEGKTQADIPELMAAVRAALSPSGGPAPE
jgi:1-acyl-sn-glycerol-3-phosphate acyltransferase